MLRYSGLAVVNVVQLRRHRVGVCTHDSLRARCSLFTFTKSASCFIADPCIIRYYRRSAETCHPSRNQSTFTHGFTEKKEKNKKKHCSFIVSYSNLDVTLFMSILTIRLYQTDYCFQSFLNVLLHCEETIMQRGG